MNAKTDAVSVVSVSQTIATMTNWTGTRLTLTAAEAARWVVLWAVPARTTATVPHVPATSGPVTNRPCARATEPADASVPGIQVKAPLVVRTRIVPRVWPASGTARARSALFDVTSTATVAAECATGLQIVEAADIHAWFLWFKSMR